MIVYAPELRKSRYGPRLDETEVEAGVDRGYCIYPGKRYGRDEIMESHRRFGTLGHPRGGTGIFFIIITHYGSRCIHNKRGFFFFLMGPRVVGVVGGRVVYLTVLVSSSWFR